jgi:Family of unknown function (DUF6496)
MAVTEIRLNSGMRRGHRGRKPRAFWIAGNRTNEIREVIELSIKFSGDAMTQSRKPSSNSRPKYGKAAGKTVASAVRRMKKGTLKSGPGGKGGRVKSREQAIAIGLSEAREKGAKVPRKKNSR